MGQWIGSALGQILACRLCGAKPLYKPMLDCCQLDANIRNKFQWNFKQAFSSTKIHLKMSSGKWRPSCLGPNVLIGVSSEELISKVHVLSPWQWKYIWLSGWKIAGRISAIYVIDEMNPLLVKSLTTDVQKNLTISMAAMVTCTINSLAPGRFQLDFR